MNSPAAHPSPLPLLLPDHPNLDFLKDQAKRLLKQIRAGTPDALGELRSHHPRFKNSSTGTPPPALHDAQWVIARQYGFSSWTRLKDEVEARRKNLLSQEERLVQSVWKGQLEDLQVELDACPRFSNAIALKLQEALAGIADRSVWHRPQYRDMARLLISAGVEYSIWTVARLGLLDRVRLCLESKPELLEARDPQGRTPLQRAALIYGSDPACESTVDWLLQQGVTIDIFTAAAYSLPQMLQAALKADPSLVHQKCQGSTPLNWAVRPRRHQLTAPFEQVPDVEICGLLLDHGAETESRDDQENGMHPLHHVGEWCGSEETCNLLIRRGADLQAFDDIGWTPLDYAINRNRETMVACFKKHGARQTLVDWPDTWNGRRDLIFASVKRNDPKSVERLLAEDPSLALARQEGGDTPLHWACHDGHYEIAELLLKNGAEVAAQETRHWGGTALHWASERQPVLVDLLLDHGAEVNSLNHKTGQTPLHYCARCDDVPEVAEILLARGADPGLADKRGNTPLDYALKSKHLQVANLLCNHGVKTP